MPGPASGTSHVRFSVASQPSRAAADPLYGEGTRRSTHRHRRILGTAGGGGQSSEYLREGGLTAWCGVSLERDLGGGQSLLTAGRQLLF